MAGFPHPAKLRLRPYLLSAEGLDKEASKEMTDLLDGQGWRPAVNVVFSPGTVQITRRNALGELRSSEFSSLPITRVMR